VALPLVVRGASLTSILVGIEAWRPLRRLERVALSQAAHVVAISAHTRERFLAANPSATGQPIVVCHPAAPIRGELADGLVPPGFALTVGRMSSDERYKGHDSLLEAWPRVVEQQPVARLVVVGDGDDRPRLEEKARVLGLNRSVTFLGHVEGGRLNGMYADAAFFVMPSRDEGFGFVYLEAMQAGKPCVACVGAASELFDDRSAGEIVTFGNADEIASACIRLFADPQRCAQLGRTAAGIVQQRFLPSHFIERFREALDLPRLTQAPPARQAYA
jgi:glycosyltransferase involved in cell wall biosynthesis